jgi:hypothetical protein
MTKTTKKTDTPSVEADDLDTLILEAAVETTAPKSIFEVYETNLTEEEEGRWFNNIIPGADFKLRRFTAKPVQAMRNKLQLAFSKHADKKTGEYPEHISVRIVNEQMGAIIADWRGAAIVDRDGVPLVYSPDAAKALMDQLPNLRTQLLMISMDMANFRTAERQEIEGN